MWMWYDFAMIGYYVHVIIKACTGYTERNGAMSVNLGSGNYSNYGYSVGTSSTGASGSTGNTGATGSTGSTDSTNGTNRYDGGADDYNYWGQADENGNHPHGMTQTTAKNKADFPSNPTDG